MLRAFTGPWNRAGSTTTLFHSRVTVRLMSIQSFKSRFEILKRMHFRVIQTRFPQLIATVKGYHSIKMAVSILEVLQICPSSFFPSKCFMWKAQVFFVFTFCFTFQATNSIFGKLTHENFPVSVFPYWGSCRRKSSIHLSPIPLTPLFSTVWPIFFVPLPPFVISVCLSSKCGPSDYSFPLLKTFQWLSFSCQNKQTNKNPNSWLYHQSPTGPGHPLTSSTPTTTLASLPGLHQASSSLRPLHLQVWHALPRQLFLYFIQALFQGHLIKEDFPDYYSILSNIPPYSYPCYLT